MKKITTVILAAGNSTRFKHNKSKIYQDLAGLSIIEHVYNVAKKVSRENIIFVCNKNNDIKLKSLFPAANFVIQKKQKGTADAIYQAKKYLKNTNVLILFGDVPLITYNSIRKLILNFYNNNSIGSMIAFKAENPFGYGRVITEGKKVTSVIEELNATLKQKKYNYVIQESCYVIQICYLIIFLKFLIKMLKKKNICLIFLTFLTRLIKILILS